MMRSMTRDLSSWWPNDGPGSDGVPTVARTDIMEESARLGNTSREETRILDG